MPPLARSLREGFVLSYWIARFAHTLQKQIATDFVSPCDIELRDHGPQILM